MPLSLHINLLICFLMCKLRINIFSGFLWWIFIHFSLSLTYTNAHRYIQCPLLIISSLHFPFYFTTSLSHFLAPLSSLFIGSYLRTCVLFISYVERLSHIYGLISFCVYILRKIINLSVAHILFVIYIWWIWVVWFIYNYLEIYLLYVKHRFFLGQSSKSTSKNSSILKNEKLGNFWCLGIITLRGSWYQFLNVTSIILFLWWELKFKPMQISVYKHLATVIFIGHVVYYLWEFLNND